MKKILTYLTLFVAAIGIVQAPITSTALAEAASAPSANFTATDGQVFDASALSFEAYAYNVQLQNLKSSDDNPKIEFFLNGDLIGTNTKIYGNDGISIKLSQLQNGVYKLSAKLTDTNGQTGTVMALSGSDHLTFTITNYSRKPLSNPQAPPAGTLDKPIISGSDSTECLAKQEVISTLVERIVKRYQKQIKTIDGVNDTITEYYQKLDNTADFQSAINATDIAGDKADLAVLDLINASKLACASDGTYDMTQFKKALQDTRDAVRAYREGLAKLVKQLEAAA